MNRNERAKPRDERLIEVRGPNGSVRRIEARRSMQPVDIRADGDEPGFGGYASTFWAIDSYGTAVAPGAFTRTLDHRASRIMVLYQHNPDWVAGKHLEAEQDSVGLKVRAKILDTLMGREVITLLREDAGLGLSFGFNTVRERPATADDPLIITENTPEWVVRNLPQSVYVLEEIKLWEYSPVTFPANPEAAPSVVYSDAPGMRLAPHLLEDLRAGRLSDTDRALVAEIASAYASLAPDRNPSAPRTDVEARADREFIASFLAREMGLDLEHILCAA